MVATALIGYPLALVYLGAGPRWQRVILFVVILPLLTSVVVRTFAWIVILGREGVINQSRPVARPGAGATASAADRASVWSSR